MPTGRPFMLAWDSEYMKGPQLMSMKVFLTEFARSSPVCLVWGLGFKRGSHAVFGSCPRGTWAYLPESPTPLISQGSTRGPSIGATCVTRAIPPGAAPFAPNSGMLVIAWGPVKALEIETPPAHMPQSIACGSAD